MKEILAGITFCIAKVHLAILKRAFSAVRADSLDGIDRCTQAKNTMR